MTQGQFDRHTERREQVLAELAAVQERLSPGESSAASTEERAEEKAPFLETKHRLGSELRRLNDLLARAEIIPEGCGSSVVTLGSWVSVRYLAGGQERTFTLTDDGTAGHGAIGIASPLGQALLNHQVGDKVKFRVVERTHQVEITGLQ